MAAGWGRRMDEDDARGAGLGVDIEPARLGSTELELAR
jgi:hypothetical protein